MLSGFIFIICLLSSASLFFTIAAYKYRVNGRLAIIPISNLINEVSNIRVRCGVYISVTENALIVTKKSHFTVYTTGGNVKKETDGRDYRLYTDSRSRLPVIIIAFAGNVRIIAAFVADSRLAAVPRIDNGIIRQRHDFFMDAI